MPTPRFGFGIEIEVIVEPHKLRVPAWAADKYYERLAQALRNRQLSAKADPLTGGYSKHPEHYDKWFITSDGSLGQHSYPIIGLEAVSPKLDTEKDWEQELRLFWEAMSKVFKMPQKNSRCGSHVHVAPIGRSFNLKELKTIAFAIVVYEDHVNKILPLERRDHPYCQPNSKLSSILKSYFSTGKSSQTLRDVGKAIENAQSKTQLCNLIQGANRFVLWNFQNTVKTSGTVEFRGGRCLRGIVRTLRWISFAIGFIWMALDQDLLSTNSIVYTSPTNQQQTFIREVDRFWDKIRASADRMRMVGLIPADWKRMNETKN